MKLATIAAVALAAASSAAAQQTTQSFRDCPECPEMVVIPAGTFVMGSPWSEEDREENEGPQRTVRIAEFSLGKYEVTFAEWDACARDRGCRAHDDGSGQQPVTDVTWNDAKAYVAWLSRKTGKTYRLPSEAEWEYAARARTRTRFSWGDDVGRNYANCGGCGSQWDRRQPAPVGSFAANAFGLRDMHGNVEEWVEDCWNDDHRGAPEDGAARTAGDCDQRVLRGGSYYDSPGELRSAYRGYGMTDTRGSTMGFRVARNP